MSKFLVLCVDDEKIVLNALKEQLRSVLKSFDSVIEVTDDPLDALELIEELSEEGIEPGVIISDQLMPELNGDELLSKIHAQYPDAIKILLTGQADAEAVGNAVNHANLYRYMSKPWEAEDLLLTVREAMKSFVQTRELKANYEELQQAHHQLKQVNQALKDHSENLQDKVQERTQDLRVALEKLENQHVQLKDTQSQLVLSEKMASLGTLVAGVAHELNNPVNFTYNGAKVTLIKQGKLEVILRELTEGEPDIWELFEDHLIDIKQGLDSIAEGSQRIKSIVQDLLLFARHSWYDAAEPKTTGIVDGLKATLSLVKSSFHRKVEFITDFQENPAIDCWPGQLNQVFMNIIVNGCQAIVEQQASQPKPKRGTLTLRTYLNETKTLLHVAVTDDGPGIPEDTLGKIFEPFFTTKRVGAGTGLGLSISYGIIEKHQGDIQVESKPGQGTTMTISLPLRLSNS